MGERSLLDFVPVKIEVGFAQSKLHDQMVDHDKKVIDRVIHLMAKYAYARDNDFFLIILYLQKYEKINQLSRVGLNDMARLASICEVIRRARQKVQHVRKLYPPSDKVLLQRAHKRKVLELINHPSVVEEKITV